MALAALEPDHLRTWLRRGEWGDSTRHHYGSVVKIWARWCSDTYKVPYPFGRVHLPPITSRKAAPDGALEAILRASSPQYRDFLTVLIETGCRPGEVRTLEAPRISLETHTAEVDGKTGPRLVGLSRKALDVLGPLCRRWPEGPVLRDERGRPWSENRLWARMDQARKKSGVTGVVAYHARHDFWGRAKKNRVGDVEIAKQLGHANLRMLARVYAHADREIMASVARRASGE
jgi:integrase